MINPFVSIELQRLCDPDLRLCKKVNLDLGVPQNRALRFRRPPSEPWRSAMIRINESYDTYLCANLMGLQDPSSSNQIRILYAHPLDPHTPSLAKLAGFAGLGVAAG